MSPHGRFSPETMTPVQEAFMVAMTDQRAANLLEAADFVADLSPEAKEWLRHADKQKINDLESTLRFMDATNIVWKFLWVGGGTIFGLAVALTQAWDWLSKYFTVKIK